MGYIISRRAVFGNFFDAPEANVDEAVGGDDERDVFGERFDVLVEEVAHVDLVKTDGGGVV